MMRRLSSAQSLACVLLLLVGACAALADTIVLKNGRRIIASNVVEEDGHVSYETPAGHLSLPKSIVDHIERGGVLPSRSGMSVPPLDIAPPTNGAVDASEEISRGAVHEGRIDREYIAKLELAARSGAAGASDRAALAHHAAAQFELSRGNMEDTLAEERSALNFAPRNPVLLVSVAYLYLRRGEYRESLEYLERARRVAPDSADIAQLAGWAWYGMNNLDQAISEWKRALAIRPDAKVQAALEKAQRDRAVEEDFKENESSHFTLRYHGGAEPELARDVLRTLEAHFTAIESELDFTPREPIGVILYTEEAFADISRAPSWVGALNDGRIRVPVQGLTAVSPELSRVLKHELTHSFVTQKTVGRCPVWLQEGLAQWIEGQRSGENAAVLVKVYDDGQALPLGVLEGSWMRLPPDAAGYAYAWSLANVEYIIETNGMGDITRILERIAAGDSTEEALRTVLRTDYTELARSTAKYLRGSYVH
ncbi:MAG: tetratricopeptide repeat protein [Candidatus Acidiferrales bacterium]|jgi:tetratricopeptide (TPR) repeat protein